MQFREQPAVGARSALGQRALEKPTILVTNQHSLSDAEDFTEGYRAMHLGKVVGEPTAGWIIFTSNRTLLDGTSVRLPSTRITDAEGKDMEMHPRPVDLLVVRPIGESYSGKDSQLDAAVKELLGKSRHGGKTGMRIPPRAAVVLLLIGACSDSTKPGDPASVASLSLTPTLTTVVKGSQTRLTPLLVDSAGSVITGLTPSWSSSASEIATVSPDGSVTGVGYGPVSITASIGSRSASAELVVTAAPTLKSYTVLDLGASNSRGYVRQAYQ